MDTFEATGLKIREIYHRQFGICQLIYFGATRCWVGVNEKHQSLWAPDVRGYPDLDALKQPQYLYQEQLSFIQILEPSFDADCMLMSLRRKPAP